MPKIVGLFRQDGGIRPVTENKSERCDTGFILAVSAVALTVGLLKPVHMDDTAHLEIASHIAGNPLRPMSGLVNWADTARPIHELNQPHLFFYVLAAFSRLPGRWDVWGHLLGAAGTIVCVTLLLRLARDYGLPAAWRWCLALSLLPALLPGQNIMVDSTLLACWLLLFCLLTRPRLRYAAAAATIALAVLIKYSSLVLAPLFAVACWLRGRRRQVLWLVLPAGAVAAWSVFNLYDYGGIHIAGRTSASGGVGAIAGMSVDFVAGLGAVCPVSLALLAARSQSRIRVLIPAASLAAGVAIALGLVARGNLSPGVVAAWAVFYANGVFILAHGAGAAWLGMRDNASRYATALLALWFAGSAAFHVLFGPFMAVRHVLLSLPPLLLLVARANGRDEHSFGPLAGGAAGAALALALCVSDHRLAAVYRDRVPEIARAAATSGSVWFTGHWGWQWYANRAGFRQSDAARTRFAPGDSVVVPRLAHREIPLERLNLPMRLRTRLVVPGNALTLARTMCVEPFGGYYAFSFERGAPPWRLSRAPLEQFDIYTVALPFGPIARPAVSGPYAGPAAICSVIMPAGGPSQTESQTELQSRAKCATLPAP